MKIKGAFMMAVLVWIANDIGDLLSAEGYPISIRRTMGDPPFKLITPGQTVGYYTLDYAKMDAERKAREIDEFLGKPSTGMPINTR